MVNKCDRCFKEVKDNEEVFETDDGNYICLSCLDDSNNKFELLKDLENDN